MKAALAFANLCTNRWLKIEVTAEKRSPAVSSGRKKFPNLAPSPPYSASLVALLLQ